MSGEKYCPAVSGNTGPFDSLCQNWPTVIAFPQSVETHMYEERAVVISLECDPSIVKMIVRIIYSIQLYHIKIINIVILSKDPVHQ